jgi:predicted MFS family arabinose efflux permease
MLIFRDMLGPNRSRSALAFTLMVAQACLFNAVFFTYGLVLTHFYKVPEQHVGLYLLPLAVGNFAGPLALGHLFDTLGRRKMIAGTFGISALLLLVTGPRNGSDHAAATPATESSSRCCEHSGPTPQL